MVNLKLQREKARGCFVTHRFAMLLSMKDVFTLRSLREAKKASRRAEGPRPEEFQLTIFSRNSPADE
jgi:hypothetical protein